LRLVKNLKQLEMMESKTEILEEALFNVEEKPGFNSGVGYKQDTLYLFEAGYRFFLFRTNIENILYTFEFVILSNEEINIDIKTDSGYKFTSLSIEGRKNIISTLIQLLLSIRKYMPEIKHASAAFTLISEEGYLEKASRARKIFFTSELKKATANFGWEIISTNKKNDFGEYTMMINF